MADRRFYIPTAIVAGAGSFGRLGKLVRPLGSRALVVGSPGRRALLERAAELLAAEGVETRVHAAVGNEPTLTVVEAVRAEARALVAQVVVGIGGGSTIDAAKAAAGLYGQEGTVAEYHAGRPLAPGLGVPLVAVPTTAGTGAEVTRNAVLIDAERGVKQSIRDDSWFPALAVVDPELTLSLPPAATASTGADALCQAIEAYVSIGAGALTDPLAAGAIQSIGRSLEQAVAHGDDLAARSDMLYGSLLAGMAMANAGLGAVHGLAHPLGGRYGIPHGVVCGLLLPYVMAYNLPYATERYARVAELLGLTVSASAPAAAGELAEMRVREMLARAGVPDHLASFGVQEADLEAVTAEALGQSSLRYNPRPMQTGDVLAVLRQAL
jgi:alcohol dehydrogenase class IV